MRIALISDLHGNVTALSALEKHLQQAAPDEIWCLGDLVGKGPNSHITFDWAMDRCSIVLGGNWDFGVGRKEYTRDYFYHHQLGKDRLESLSSLPLEHRLTMSGRKIRLIHGRPVMSRLINIQEPKESFLPFLEPDIDLFIYADCHRQGIRTLKGQIVNIGSVGNALGLPLVQYALLEGQPGDQAGPLEVRMMTVPYDNKAEAREARRFTDLPCQAAYIHEVLTGEYAASLRTPFR